MPLENPKRADGPLIILNGNLAPDGAVAKVSGVKVRRHVGPTKRTTTTSPSTISSDKTAWIASSSESKTLAGPT